MQYFKKLMLVLSIAIMFTQLFGGDSGQFRVNTQNSQLTDIEFNLPDWSISSDHKIYSKGTELTVSKNDIEIPFYSTCIAVPQNSHVEILSEDKGETKVYSNISLSASKETIDRKFQKDQNQLVEISSVKTLRDYQIVSVNIYPFQYDQTGSKLNVNNKIRIRISHDSGDRYTQDKPVSKAFEPLYQALIANYDQIRETRSGYQKPSLLIIHPNSNAIQARLNQLVDWKMIRGFDVKTASLSETGNTTSSIKTFIQNQYTSAVNRPEYVLLIGDATGSLAIPTYHVFYAVEGGNGDYPYTHLSGNDTIGDLFIGRMSIESSTDFDVMVSKIIFNEKYPTQAGTDWMNRSLLMGETNVSGQTCITTNYYIKETIKQTDPNHEFNELYGSVVNQSQTTAAATSGALNFHYRGYYNMNNYTVSHINNINNIKKMFNAVWITCNTGHFATTELSRIEKVTRMGTVSEPRGAVTAIGMSTSHTLTAYNNLMSCAIYDGLYTHGMNTMGQAMLYAKIRVQTAYSNYEGVANDLVHWLNLMGDPSVMAHKDVPVTLVVDAPESINKGQNYIQVAVRQNNNQPLESAVVTLKSSDSQYYSGLTNENGVAVINLDNELSGNLQLTVSKEGCLTNLKTVAVAETGGIALDSYTISNADNNAIVQEINPGTTYTINGYFKNFSSSTYNNIQFRLRSMSPYIVLSDSLANLSQLNTNTVSSSVNFRFTVNPNCPDDYQIPFELVAVCNNAQFTSCISVNVNSYNFQFNSYQIVNYAQNAPIGMNAQMLVNFKNTSHTSLTGLSLRLRSNSFNITITDSLSLINNVNVGANANNADDPFGITVNNNVVPGTQIPMEMVFVYNNMEIKKLPFTLLTQNALISDPLGPDNFGYIILDQGDLNYLNCPNYEWVEIASLGTDIGIVDSYDNMDMVQSVTLPFSFRFYGEIYNQITVSSNGFFVFGVTTNPAMRNTPLPGSGAPVNMVAPFWADIVVQDSGDSGVYTYYHPTMHAFIIEWHNVRNYYYRNNQMSPFTNFQVIIYDSQYYPNMPIDGVMKFQYKDFHMGYQGTDEYPCNFFTAGIQNQTGTVGLTYAYNNQYSNSCTTLGNQKSLLVTTTRNLTNNSSLFALPLQFSVLEDMTMTYELSQYITGYTPETAGDYTLTCSSSEHINVTINGLNVSFTPVANWSGIESLLFILNINGRQIVSRLSAVKVVPVNDAPYVSNPLSSITFNDNNTYTGLNLYQIFSDPDLPYGGVLNFTCQPVDSISISINNGEVTMVPAQNWTGQRIVQFTATDDSLLFVSHSVTVNVIDVNEAPVINFPTIINGLEDEVLLVNLENYIQDIDNAFNELDIQVFSSAHLNVDLNMNQLVITPAQNFNGQEFIRVIVSDQMNKKYADRLAVVDSVLIKIMPVNDLPVVNSFTPDPPNVTVETGVPVFFSVSASDVDNTTLYHYWFINGQNQQNYSNTMTKTFNESGEYTVACRISDGFNYIYHNYTVIVTLSNSDIVVKETALNGNYPNPFNPETKINYQLHKDGKVNLKIYNQKGQLVKELINDVQKQGRYSLVWNGDNQDGRKVASGIYYIMMKTPEYSKIHKMVLIK